MPLVDYLVFVLGVYGISWILVHSKIVSPLRDKISSVSFFNNLSNCIVCTSVWVSVFFAYHYFNSEAWFTKTLIVGSTVTTTWVLANLIGDLE